MMVPLRQLAITATDLSELDIVREVRELEDRVQHNRWFLTCVGQFKRGKSTLLNALVGEPVLPTGVVPVTSAITVIRHGAEPSAAVQFTGGVIEVIPIPQVGEYVAEAHNPGNRKGVRAVEIALPSPILESGLCLVDTPGLGSVFDANTNATRDFVPQIDAVLIVIGADPPITGDELSLIEMASRETPELLVVMNKADRVPAMDLLEAGAFARRMLSDRLGRPVDRVFTVSAAEHLAGAVTRDWAQFEDAVWSLAHRRESMMAHRIARRTTVLRDDLVSAIVVRQDALRRPVTESEAQLRALQELVRAAEGSLADLTGLLDAEGTRLLQALAERRAVFVQRARAEGRHRLQERLMVLEVERISRDAALTVARSVARACVETWGGETERRAHEMYRRATSRFVSLANEFLRQVTGGTPTIEGLRDAVTAESEINAPARFHFTEMMTVASPSPWQAIADRCSWDSRRRRAVTAAAHTYLDRLIETNVSRFTNDLAGRVADSRRQLEADVRRVLRDVVRRAEAALETAQAAHRVGTTAVAGELRRLDHLHRDLMKTTINQTERPHAI